MSPGAESYSDWWPSRGRSRFSEDFAGRGGLNEGNCFRIAARPSPQIGRAIVAEGSDGLSGFGINGLQKVVDGEQETVVFVVGALPVVQGRGGDDALLGPVAWTQTSLPWRHRGHDGIVPGHQYMRPSAMRGLRSTCLPSAVG